jgi:hypothetical protein
MSYWKPFKGADGSYLWGKCVTSTSNVYRHYFLAVLMTTFHRLIKWFGHCYVLKLHVK